MPLFSLPPSALCGKIHSKNNNIRMSIATVCFIIKACSRLPDKRVILGKYQIRNAVLAGPIWGI
ncbi:hypothetical protein [Massilia sp. NR 4-1]|uniref:hypothetical protein n=1 Tax=Massilia sp. NR 4-1 TaxID=1678028 RepID=UPI000AF053C3|nr:hypothetical protein [Massilia sp. NR 4-1]